MLTLAGCIILDNAGRLLLLHRRTPERTQWELPGGKVETGEDPAAAAAREAREELGVRVEIARELGSQTFTEDGRTMRYAWFLAIVTAGTPRPAEAKFDAARYFTWDELATRTDLSVNTRNLLAAYQHGTETSPRSKARRMRNEAVIARANQTAKQLAARVMDATSQALLPLNFTCECSDATCAVTIQLSVDDYNLAHQQPDHFVIKPGHEQLDIERVVAVLPDSAAPEYCIVEKYALGQQRRDVTPLRTKPST